MLRTTNIPVPTKLTKILLDLEQRKLDTLQGWLATLPEGNYRVSADYSTLIQTHEEPDNAR